MTTQTFNMLDYVRELESVGVSREQAEVQAKAMNNAISLVVQEYDEKTRKELVTKGDLQETKHELLKWMMGMTLAQTALIFAVMAFFIK